MLAAMSQPPDRGTDAASAMVPLRILHGAMMASVLIYGLILVTVVKAGQAGEPVTAADAVARAAAPAEPPGPIFTIVLVVLSAVSILGLLLFRARKLPGKDALFGGGPRKVSRSSYFVICIASWAFAESIAVYGLLLGFVHRDVTLFLPFAGASLLVLLYLRPQRAHLE
jgi:hypothetical protein